jgi:hypothetical protein
VTSFIHALVAGGLPASLTFKSISIHSVSNTGFAISQSRNRVVTFRIKGEYGLPLAPGGQFTLDLSLLFFRNSDHPRNDNVFAALVDHSITVSGGIGKAAASTLVRQEIVQRFAAPRSVFFFGVNIPDPASTNILSLKVLPDGAVRIYLKPGLKVPALRPGEVTLISPG